MKKPLDKDKVFTCVLCILLGVALSVLLCIIIAIHSPAQKKVELCNDGWTREEKGGRIYETYLEENDTCKKGDK